MIARAFALALVVPACLALPDRPHGLGAPIAPGGVIRHQTAVGDIDGDGYDDLVTWGNEGAPGTKPTAFVYFGGETLENPDVRADLAVDDPDAHTWFEAIAVSVAVSADGKLRGIAVLAGQDPPGGSGRSIYVELFPDRGRGLGERQVSASKFYKDWGGTAPAAGSDYALFRDAAAFPTHEVVVGGAFDAHSFVAPISSLAPTHGGFAFPDKEFVSSVLRLPAVGSTEDLLVVTEAGVFRTHGDLDPALGAPPVNDAAYALGPMVPFSDQSGPRFARGRAADGHFYAVTDSFYQSAFDIIDTPSTGEPIAYQLGSTTRADDLAIANVGGSDLVDVVVLVSGNLGVYRDVTLGATVQAAEVVGSHDPLPDYDTLAVGNFHGDDRLEIYVLSSTHPELLPLCYRLGATLDRCDGE